MYSLVYGAGYSLWKTLKSCQLMTQLLKSQITLNICWRSIMPENNVQSQIEVASLTKRIIEEVNRAIVGKTDVLYKMMAAFLSGGHVLLEDYPGLAKTLIANSFANVLGMSFRRIQFTPDLLPGDITGGYVYDKERNQFALRKGPIFAHFVLADEINRASP